MRDEHTLVKLCFCRSFAEPLTSSESSEKKDSVASLEVPIDFHATNPANITEKNTKKNLMGHILKQISYFLKEKWISTDQSLVDKIALSFAFEWVRQLAMQML